MARTARAGLFVPRDVLGAAVPVFLLIYVSGVLWGVYPAMEMEICERMADRFGRAMVEMGWDGAEGPVDAVCKASVYKPSVSRAA